MLVGASACSSDDDNTNPSGSGGGGTTTSTTGDGGGGGEPGTGGNSAGGGGSGPVNGCTEPTEVPCADEVFQALNLQDDITPGLIESQPDGAGFTSLINAVAGGAMNPNPDSYTYGKFTANGLEKVEISDENAIDSMDWDIAFRRAVIRINSGNSGPSCVTAAPLAGTSYDDLTALPASLPQGRTDTFYSDACVFQSDGSGQPTAPGTALASFYAYNQTTHCLGMSSQVYLLQLADSSYVKLVVTAYYSPDVQAECDAGNPLPQGPTGSGNYQIRWAFLQ
ncbi:uncharacterized protein CMC5_001620 [Chondromyces crocatus]|uniref:Uncharacterized protein n=2 Tax=Chondromyces crocatus TaxID=52 RepID=A0A0K1E599_CHOCO|nr:uncharacterized protein CMC5_001620 [Chondromyces crocatus]